MNEHILNSSSCMYYCIGCTVPRKLRLISHLKLLKRNSNTTGSSRLCSCHNSRDSPPQTFCSRTRGPLTTLPLFHALEKVLLRMPFSLISPTLTSLPSLTLSLNLLDHFSLRFLLLCKEYIDHLSWFLAGPEMSLVDLHGSQIDCDLGQARHLTSLCLSLLTCKTGVIKVPRLL